LVDYDALQKRVGQIKHSLQRLERYADLDLADFLKNQDIQDIVEYNIFTTINLITDIANHIAVDEGLGDISTLSDGFRLLWQAGVFSQEEYETYRAMVGFRNIIAHEYMDLNKRLVFGILKNQLGDIRHFIHRICDLYLGR
jgi:uncharacterized protein YutE (UPF0331/DUF86 family)